MGKALYTRHASFVPSFDNDKQDAIEDQHSSNDWGIHKMLFHIFIKSKSDHCCRKTCNNNLSPEIKCLAPLLPRFTREKRVELADVQDYDSENCAKLDYDEKHIHKRRRHVETDELIDEDHMARTGYRQPFRHSLYNPQNSNLHQLHKCNTPSKYNPPS